MTMSLARLALEGEVHRDLPMNPYAYGAIALALFALGLAVLWAFRGTAQKVRDSGSAHPGGNQHPHGH